MLKFIPEKRTFAQSLRPETIFTEPKGDNLDIFKFIGRKRKKSKLPEMVVEEILNCYSFEQLTAEPEGIAGKTDFSIDLIVEFPYFYIYLVNEGKTIFRIFPMEDKEELFITYKRAKVTLQT
jgi:hypothetical protein